MNEVLVFGNGISACSLSARGLGNLEADEDAVIFVVVVVSKTGDEDEEEKMSSKKMRTNGLLIEEVVGEAFNIKEEQSKGNVTFRDESKALMKGKVLKELSGGSFMALAHEGMVKGLDHIDHPNQVCEGCLFGKYARSSFPKESTSRAKEPLQLIHTDLCGPITPPSHGKNLYFMLFIDDYSRKTWVYFLKEKSQAFEAFKTFKAMVEKEKGLKIKSLSKEFNKFCEDNGIRIFLTAPYSPQQNRVVERKNRTILNMVRSMLKTKKMPKEFWAEAVDCATSHGRRDKANRKERYMEVDDSSKRLLESNHYTTPRQNTKGEVKKYKARIVAKGHVNSSWNPTTTCFWFLFGSKITPSSSKSSSKKKIYRAASLTTNRYGLKTFANPDEIRLIRTMEISRSFDPSTVAFASPAIVKSCAMSTFGAANSSTRLSMMDRATPMPTMVAMAIDDARHDKPTVFKVKAIGSGYHSTPVEYKDHRRTLTLPPTYSQGRIYKFLFEEAHFDNF
nr:retrovirus-related Pol polyprotein from transposon TNT 1-94 [Tanacetum cinerariifolium]